MRTLLSASAASLAFALVLAACHEEPELPPPDQTYTVRGVVEQLPAQGHGDMMVHHESIEKFVDKDGNVSEMKSMVMPFTPAKDLSLEGISPGDAVKMTFEVRWEGDPLLRVVKIEKLPAGTELKL